MEFRGMEGFAVEALRAPEIQRLRRVRQLGLVYLVFPGAEHSRFVHGLGASYLAARFARSLETATREFLPESLRADETVVRDLVLAALCHDLGHGPLSHPWEQQLIGGRFYLPYLARLFQSDVDVDRCDFVLRDAYQTGVAYGRYDVDWLVSTVTVGEAAGAPVIGFDSVKAPRVVEQLLIARRALYDTVYHHPGVRSAEGMVGLLLARLKENREAVLPEVGEGFAELKKAIGGETLTLPEFLALDDHNLWVFVQRVGSIRADPVAADLARRILDRDLFKPVPIVGDRLQQFMNANPPEAIELVDQVLRRSGYQDAPSYRLYDAAPFWFFHRDPEQGSMFVDARDPRRAATSLREHPELVHHRREKREMLRLYVPRDVVDTVTRAMSNAGA